MCGASELIHPANVRVTQWLDPVNPAALPGPRPDPIATITARGVGYPVSRVRACAREKEVGVRDEGPAQARPQPR
jgi:hypothetical protein